MKRWRVLVIGLLIGLIGFAGVTFEKTNGIYTAKPGVTCTTRDSFATVFMNDLDRARNMISSSDNEAIKKFIAEKRMTWTKVGVVVIIEQRFDNNIKVRRKGEAEALWMPAYGVNCEERDKPNKADKVKKRVEALRKSDHVHRAGFQVDGSKTIRVRSHAFRSSL